MAGDVEPAFEAGEGDRLGVDLGHRLTVDDDETRGIISIFTARDYEIGNTVPVIIAGRDANAAFDVIEDLGLNYHLGSAFAYIWRSGRKGDAAQALQDLEKAKWYLDREIKRRNSEG